ncbi:XRE family transcriptional regulator [Actinomadura viridis]|uniref:XRE family transcriptional regulator n=1 Tax=Actinomadura viridis TaxID=58110 RepID=UPI00369049CB
MKRRAALQLLAAFGAGTAVPPGVVEQVLSGVEEALGNPLDIDEWERVVHEYAERLILRPAGSLAPQMTADIIAVGELLRKEPPASVRRGLLHVSAELSGVLAVDLGDAGDERAARLSWSTATRAADASGDRDLRVWIRARQADEACWTERPDQVITTLTREAIEIADGAPSAGLARAHTARAYLAARHGHASKAQASLADLKRTFDNLPPDTNVRGLFGFREAQLRWGETYVRTLLGEPGAERSLEQALALYMPQAHRATSNLQLMKAAMLVRSREVDAGLRHAIAAIEAQPDAKSTGRRLLSNQILRTLPEKARTLPAARELHALAV